MWYYNMNDSTKRQVYVTLILVTVIGCVGLSGIAAAQSLSPSDAVDNVTDTVVGEIADIGSALLALYGLGQVVGLGIGDGDGSGYMKKIGISFGLAILLQSWSQIDTWITNNVSASSSIATGQPLDVGSVAMTVSTYSSEAVATAVLIAPT
jgi:hypothetical protein